jgi:Holliday junction resolvase
MGAMSRRKGAAAEREVAQLLRDHGIPARRGVQYAGGPDSPDVVGLDGVHIEVKRTESLRLWSAMEQATAEKRDGDVASVWHRANGRPWVVILSAADFLAMYRAAKGGQP